MELSREPVNHEWLQSTCALHKFNGQSTLYALLRARQQWRGGRARTRTAVALSTSANCAPFKLLLPICYWAQNETNTRPRRVVSLMRYELQGIQPHCVFQYLSLLRSPVDSPAAAFFYYFFPVRSAFDFYFSWPLFCLFQLHFLASHCIIRHFARLKHNLKIRGKNCGAETNSGAIAPWEFTRGAHIFFPQGLNSRVRKPDWFN